MKGTDIIPYHSFLYHLFIVFMINSVENIIMMAIIKTNAGHPISIRDVRNNINSERVKNSLINSIISTFYRYVYLS